MKIITGRPPNFDVLMKAFPKAAGRDVIFAYAPDIYIPSGSELPPQLLDHESVHIERQLIMGVEAWWEKYLVDAEFRYEEELLAHRAEYKKLCEMYPTRQQRKYFLRHVGKKLSAALYGKMVTERQAIQDIRGE